MNGWMDALVNLVFDPIHAAEWSSLGLIGCLVGEVATTIFTLPFEPFFEEDIYETGTLMKFWWDEAKSSWGHVFTWN